MTVRVLRASARRSGMLPLIAVGLLCGTSPNSSAESMTRDDFSLIARDGFGDRQNSFAWSTRWWNDRLYVGTSRSLYCVQQATIVRFLPSLWFLYPPWDTGFDECTNSPQDLPLAGEIWCYDPVTRQWDLLFQSPEDVPIPGHPGKVVARDTGFRTMTLFSEQSGIEALYVGGICSESINPGVPPPRLLRSTDGQTFDPVPQDPGTFLGSLTVKGNPFNGFRSLQVYDGRLFMVASQGLTGFGALIESADPEQGNDSFHFAAPEDEVFYQLASYNGYLYAGTAVDAFRVVKTDASGTPPYTFSTVIPEGAFLTNGFSLAVVSMFEYDGKLYVGTDRPAEVYRINPDDSWELVVGTPRNTPNGPMRPLSGLGAGFDNPRTLHIWRMQDAYGSLYTGTMDQTTKWSANRCLREWLNPLAGFDLYSTRNGYYYTMVTRNGLRDKFDEGLRQFAFHPDHGLIVGSANPRFGCNVWQGRPDPSRLPAPQQLDAEGPRGRVLLSWGTTLEAARYHVYRSKLAAEDLSYQHIATTFEPYFRDVIVAGPSRPVHYYVIAETANGIRSLPSNVARVPFLGTRPTFASLRADLESWGGAPELLADVDNATALYFKAHSYSGAAQTLLNAQTKIRNDPELVNPNWRAADAEVVLARMARRAQLIDRGFFPWWWMLF